MTTLDDELADSKSQVPYLTDADVLPKQSEPAGNDTPEYVYELLALGYMADQGVRTLGLFRNVESAKGFYTPLRKETTYRFEETTDGWFAEVGNDGVTLYINKREVLP